MALTKKKVVKVKPFSLCRLPLKLSERYLIHYICKYQSFAYFRKVDSNKEVGRVQILNYFRKSKTFADQVFQTEKAEKCKPGFVCKKFYYAFKCILKSAI